jgi:hypothetical protein
MKTNVHFLIIVRAYILRMRNVSDKSCRENQNTHFVFSNFFLGNHAFCENMWKYIVEWGKPQTTIWCMRLAGCIPKATHTRTHTQVV